MSFEEIESESTLPRKSTTIKYIGFGLIFCLVAVTIIWSHVESSTIEVKNSKPAIAISKTNISKTNVSNRTVFKDLDR